MKRGKIFIRIGTQDVLIHKCKRCGRYETCDFDGCEGTSVSCDLCVLTESEFLHFEQANSLSSRAHFNLVNGTFEEIEKKKETS